MPVSKKRKKDGKPVHRSLPAAQPDDQAAGTEQHPAHPQARTGKPSNPFVTQQQARRGAQRGR
jgi:hypothetical protein